MQYLKVFIINYKIKKTKKTKKKIIKMEMFSECSLCKTKFLHAEIKIGKDLFPLTCKHNLCSQCLPSILYNTLSKQGLKENIFASPDDTLKCSICENGQLKDFNICIQNYLISQQNIENSKKCSNCPKEAVLLCLSCSSSYCEVCDLSKHSKELLKFHTRINKKHTRNACSYCTENDAAKFLCLVCHNLVCEKCSRSLAHSNHEKRGLVKIYDEFESTKQEKARKILDFIPVFENFKKNMLSSFMKHSIEYSEEIDETIEELQKIKIKSQNYYKTWYRDLKTQLAFIENSFSLLQEKFSANLLDEIHPDLIYYITDTFKGLENKTILAKSFSFDFQNNNKFTEIRQNIKGILSKKKELFAENDCGITIISQMAKLVH